MEILNTEGGGNNGLEHVFYDTYKAERQLACSVTTGLLITKLIKKGNAFKMAFRAEGRKTERGRGRKEPCGEEDTHKALIITYFFFRHRKN